MTARPGLFITIEGGEGAGKTTQIARLAACLRAAGREVETTREPGGSDGAEAIRALLVTGAADRWDWASETLLLTAARRDHVERRIRPALARGAVVLCDRYVDSTRAYQGATPQARALIDALHENVIGLDPMITLMLDLPAAEGLARAAARGGEDRFESKGLDYHDRLRQAFLAIAAADLDRCAVIDAAQSPEAVAAAIQQALRDRAPGLSPDLGASR